MTQEPTPHTVREAFHHRARTKIVATLGPASNTQEKIGALMEAGVDVFRINMAHGARHEHQALIKNIRAASATQHTTVGILIDLAGPKIRLGTLHSDPTRCEEGHTFRFVRGQQAKGVDELVSNYDRLVDELDVGDRVMLADGVVSMVVTEAHPDFACARVTNSGEIRTRQGINLPGVKLTIPTLGPRDLDNAIWAAGADVDFVGLSFVRTAEEIQQLTELLRQHNSNARVIAKIEKPEALDNLEGIVDAAGGVMVARGDLGVEIDVAEIAVAQKRIINTCARFGKPVIVATQMLDSMTHSRRPTRAEATDVANAILDGADACMLSGETAVGDHPREAVEMMNRIMLATERLLKERPSPHEAVATRNVNPITAAVVHGASRIATHLHAQMVVISTRSGATALVRAKERDFVPTLGVSHSAEVLQQMSLFWGVTPLADAPMNDAAALRQHIDAWGRAAGHLKAGDQVVYIAGTGIEAGAHNSVVVHTVENA